MGIKAVSVSQLNNYIKRILQTDPILGNVTVTGEISNLKFHGSGHVYFNLRDEKSKLNCFLPSDKVGYVDCKLVEGMKVIISGYIYLYERGGAYSLNVTDIRENGQGDLAAAFQQLKARLEKEGIFDNSHKKQLPIFPLKIAVVTSETGAAVKDILKIITGKNNIVDVFIYPVLVQGPDAPDEISHAIDTINRDYSDIDVIITGRGGGSMEDLWAFNEEVVARSIYNSHIPIISAVGHETDFTIADFVADLRAETPTAAAEKAVPNTQLLGESIDATKEELTKSIHNIIERKRGETELMNPRSFGRDIKSRIVLEQMRVDNIMDSSREAVINRIVDSRNKIRILMEAVEGANPKLILARGYSIIRDKNGSTVSDMTSLSVGDDVQIQAACGYGLAKITSVRKV